MKYITRRPLLSLPPWAATACGLWTVRSWSCRLISACLDRAEQNAEMRKTAGLTDAAARGLPVRPDISRRRRDTDSVQDCPGLPAGFSVGTG